MSVPEIKVNVAINTRPLTFAVQFLLTLSYLGLPDKWAYYVLYEIVWPLWTKFFVKVGK